MNDDFENDKLDVRTVIDIFLGVLCFLALLWVQGWFPFNGFLDSLIGKDKPAQVEQVPIQPSRASQRSA